MQAACSRVAAACNPWTLCSTKPRSPCFTESVEVLPGVGVVLCTRRRGGGGRCALLDAERIRCVVINEASGGQITAACPAVLGAHAICVAIPSALPRPLEHPRNTSLRPRNRAPPAGRHDDRCTLLPGLCTAWRDRTGGRVPGEHSNTMRPVCAPACCMQPLNSPLKRPAPRALTRRMPPHHAPPQTLLPRLEVLQPIYREVHALLEGRPP